MSIAPTRPPIVAVTGGARGIGEATARALVAEGFRVAIGDIDARRAAETATAIGTGAVAAYLDVTDERSFAEFLSFTETQLGPLQVLINNAGIMPTGPFLKESADLARAQLHINIMGCLNGMRVALPGMLERHAGHIINVASVAGRSPVPGALTYAATKAAVLSATDSARMEFAGGGIEFTAILPSFTDTELIAGLQGARGVKNAQPADVGAAILAAIREPCEEVYVPASLGFGAKLEPFMPKRLRRALLRWTRADRAFLDIDERARAQYQDRIMSLVRAEGGRVDEFRSDEPAGTDRSVGAGQPPTALERRS